METILHLTDLHFGYKSKEPAAEAARKNCLDALLSLIDQLEETWKPSVVCVTGDLVWSGAASEYTEARDWLNKLLRICSLKTDRLVFCVGNHEVDRRVAVKIPRPSTASEADQTLAPPIADHFVRTFSGFNEFCKVANIPELTFGDWTNSLVGARSVNGVKFVSLNTAWFSKDDEDKGKLWVGLPQLNYLQARGQLPLTDERGASSTTVVLMHHPPEYLHEDERIATPGRPNTRDFLAARCHVLLTGHTHGEVRDPDQIARGAFHFTGGATYAGANYTNNIRLLRIDGQNLEYKSFEYDPRSAKNKWRPFPVSKLDFKSAEETGARQRGHVESIDHDRIRAALRASAERYRVRKSRLLRPTGVLPGSVQLKVSVSVSVQDGRFDVNGRLLRQKKAEQSMPLYDAARQARRTLLLGDLGTGKSTLVATLVLDSIDRSGDLIAILVPVKSLEVPDAISVKSLLESIERYVRSDVIPNAPIFSLDEFLRRHIEVLLVFDGLDELSIETASRILQRAAQLPEHWPTIQVVATARPIEISGISFADWRVVHAVAPDRETRMQLFEQELVADGIDSVSASIEAEILERALREIPSLDALASSPLTLRLLYPHLKKRDSNGALTLGDLLHELLLERLEGWERRDDKPRTLQLFASKFRTAEEKILLLATLAERVSVGDRLTADAALAVFEDAVGDATNGISIAREALEYFEWLGLITRTDSVDFLLQPLAEMVAAVGLARKWRQNPDVAGSLQVSRWRVVSFVATLVRRRGWQSALRAHLHRFVDELMKGGEGSFAAACYIVAESGDSELAEQAIASFSALPHRPIGVLQEERSVSARNVAKALWLAGDSGFDWLFREYLDPRYPFPHVGSMIISDVFKEWAILSRGHIESRHAQQLRLLVLPYLSTGEAHFFGVLDVLSVLIPDALSVENRIWYQLSALESERLGDWARDRLLGAVSDPAFRRALDDALPHRIGTGARALRLWLQLNPSSELLSTAIPTALRAFCASSHKEHEAAVVSESRERLGDERWLRFARWHLSNDDRTVSAGAAIALHEKGEVRLEYLGGALAYALHDGAYIAEAERALSHLIDLEGEEGIRWLAKRVSSTAEYGGAHSGCWRLLLSRIDSLKEAPELLADCVWNLGQFTLPRYPEIREAFSRLLNGSRSGEYRKALRRQLDSVYPEARRGAAKVLVATDPGGEGEALFVVIRGRSPDHEKHEWEELLLTLQFGSGALTALQSRIDLLEPGSRVFALALLFKAGLEIGSDQRQELLRGLLLLDNWALARSEVGESLLKTSEGLEFLQRTLSTPDSEFARKAAELLLRLHGTSISPKVEAMCVALSVSARGWSYGLADLMTRISRDKTFARLMEMACEEIRRDGGSAPIVEAVLGAIQGTASWKEPVWLMLCDDSRPGSSSEAGGVYGPTLLEYGLTYMQHRSGIGSAALECLRDPRMGNNRWIDAYQWLAVLAHEFANAPPEVLVSALVKREPIYCAAAAALIARLGELPEGVKFERASRVRHRKASGTDNDGVTPEDALQSLMELSRGSETLHPQTVQVIERALILPQIEEVILRELATKGGHGILIAAVMRHCYGVAPLLSESLPLFDVWGAIWGRSQRSQDEERLLRTWNTARMTALKESGADTATYLAEVDRKLAASGIWQIPLTSEILRIRGSLLHSQIEPVFLEYARHGTFLHRKVFGQLVSWLSGDIDDSTKSAVVDAARAAIVLLNETPWTLGRGTFANVWAFYLFPTLYWALGGKQSAEADAVFLRALQSVLERGDLQTPTAQQIDYVAAVFGVGEPLLRRVPAGRLKAVVSFGVDAPSPVLRTLCRMIQSVAETV
jgi:hypothetical protein